MRRFGKKLVATAAAATMVLGLAACGGSGSGSGGGATEAAGGGATEATEAAASGGGDGKVIEVGIINNDPNESGYRTANDKDLKAMFGDGNSTTNGYHAQYAYSLKNDEQISRTVLIIFFFQQLIHQVGTAFSRMLRQLEYR